MANSSKIKNNSKLGSVITNQYDNYNFIPNNTQDAHWIMMSPNNIDWNTSIFNEILKFVYKDRINFRFLPKLKIEKIIIIFLTLLIILM